MIEKGNKIGLVAEVGLETIQRVLKGLVFGLDYGEAICDLREVIG